MNDENNSTDTEIVGYCGEPKYFTCAEVLLFEVIDPSTGSVCKIYLDGKTEGFPQGAVVTNHALPFFFKVIGSVNKDK